jgi:hypothetical protein
MYVKMNFIKVMEIKQNEEEFDGVREKKKETLTEISSIS